MVDIDESAVTLSWSKPRNDGGKKIVGYIVEYKDPTTGRWKEANDFPCDECVYQGNIPFFHSEHFMGNFNDIFGEISHCFCITVQKFDGICAFFSERLEERQGV